jgi:hypothetical protein
VKAKTDEARKLMLGGKTAATRQSPKHGADRKTRRRQEKISGFTLQREPAARSATKEKSGGAD